MQRAGVRLPTIPYQGYDEGLIPIPEQQPDVGALLEAAADPQSGITSVKLPSGIEVKGAAPKLEPRDVAPTATNLQPVAPPPPLQGSQPNRVADFITSPGGRFILARAAQAVTGGRPDSVGFQLGQLAAEQAQTQAFQEYQALPPGTTPPPRIAAALSPQLLAEAQRQTVTERGTRLAERKFEEADKPLSTATTQLREAQTAGELTAEEKLNVEAAQNALRMQIAEFTTSPWMNIGNGFVFNWKSGAVKQAYDVKAFQASMGGNALNSADYKLFRTFASDVFLPKAWEQNQEALKQKGYSDLKEFLDAMKDPETGSVNPGKVMATLPPEARIQFAQAMSMYESARQLGIPLTSVYLQQVTELNQPTTGGTGRVFDGASSLPPDLRVGDIVNGRTYKGGAPNDPKSWE